MYNTDEIAQRIRNVTREKGITLKQLLDSCGLNINYVSEFSKGKDITGNNLYVIADYLDVSVDYLLGRTDDPEMHKKQYNSNNVNSHIICNNNENVNTSTNDSSDELDRNMFEIINAMGDFCILEQAEVMMTIEGIKKRKSDI